MSTEVETRPTDLGENVVFPSNMGRDAMDGIHR